MTYNEIRKKIDFLKNENTQLITSGFFTLNKKIEENFEEIKKIQSQCDHNYSNGICIYCDKEANEE